MNIFHLPGLGGPRQASVLLQASQVMRIQVGMWVSATRLGYEDAAILWKLFSQPET